MGRSVALVKALPTLIWRLLCILTTALLTEQAEEASAIARQKRREAEVLYIRLQKGRALSAPPAAPESLQVPAAAAPLQAPTQNPTQPSAEPTAAAARGAPLRRAGERGGLKFGFQKAKRRPCSASAPDGAEQRV